MKHVRGKVQDGAIEKSSDRGCERSERSNIAVSTFALNGQHRVLSTYDDDVWKFVGRDTNRRISSLNVNFNSIPVCFKESMKEVVWHYITHGITGGKAPLAQTVVSTFHSMRPFLVYLESLNIRSLTEATPMVCMAYADHVKKSVRLDGKEYSTGNNHHRFAAVERLYHCSRLTKCPMPAHPWSDTSAFALSGLLGGSRIGAARTQPIPDDVLAALFKSAAQVIARSDEILDLRDRVELADLAMVYEKRHTKTGAKNEILKRNGWKNGLLEFERSVKEIRDACYIVIATLSGCRNHELAFVQSMSYRSTKHDGETFWWMKSVSTKTNVGEAEWMIPPAAVNALRVMDRWAIPYQRALRVELERRRSVNPGDVEIAEGSNHVNAIFLGRIPREGMSYRTMSLASANYSIGEFSRRKGIAYSPSTHQFRRSFALFAAKSRFGDLRYLREHFKHWSMDMTLLYAMNEKQEFDLFEEISEELDAIQKGVIDTCLNPDEPLAGGGGRHIMSFRRSHPVETRESRRALVRALAPNVRLRATGHGWCTADNDDCVGRTKIEMFRCASCSNAIISRAHAEIYNAQLEQASELLKLDDIGEGGRAQVLRAVESCERVLGELDFPARTGVCS